MLTNQIQFISIFLFVLSTFLGQSLSLSINGFKNKETSSFMNFNPTMTNIILKSPMRMLKRDTPILEETVEKDNRKMRILQKFIKHKILTILQRLIETQKKKENQRVFWYLRQGR